MSDPLLVRVGEFFTQAMSRMEPRDVIKDHLLLCEQVHALLLEENTWLKTQNARQAWI